MKNIKIFQGNTLGAVLILLMMTLGNSFAHSQAGSIGDTQNITAGSDTLYLLSGRKISGNIMEFERRDFVAYGVWDTRLNELTNVQYLDKSKLHYIYTGGVYHLINEVTEQDNIDRLRRNMLIYERRSKAGMITLTTGVSLVLTGSILAEVQSNRFEESLDPDDLNDIPKYLNYAGYSFMLIGGIIKIASYEFLERGSIDITPVGVRVNF